MINSRDWDRAMGVMGFYMTLGLASISADLVKNPEKAEQEELAWILGRPPTEVDLSYYRKCKAEKRRQDMAQQWSRDVEKIRKAVFGEKGGTIRG